MIVYASLNHELDLYWLPVDGTDLEPERITDHTGDIYGARVSPGGNQIVYFSNRISGNYDIWVREGDQTPEQ